jgi:hypothetical protein
MADRVLTVSASIPKRQHFNPEMLLRRFTDEDGRLFFFNKRFPDGGVLSTTPANLFCETHLYTAKDKNGVMDVQLERDYADLESLANPIIEKIVSASRRGLRPQLTAQERDIWDVFFCNQWKRVPEIREKVFDRENIESRLTRLVATFEANGRPLTSNDASNLRNPKWVARVKKNTMIEALKHPSPEVLAILKQKGLCIAVIRKRGKSFVIGSLPVVKLNHPHREHLSDPTVEVWLPISFDIAVSPAFMLSGNELVREIYDESIVRRINRATFAQSTTIAGRSEKLIASLTHSR